MNHSSDFEIQQYVLDRSLLTSSGLEHIATCAYCMKQVRNYQMIFSEIQSENKPVFDFDLSELVLPQLPAKATRLSADQFIAGFLILFGIACVGIPVLVFGQFVLNMFAGIPSFFVYATLLSAMFILIFKILSMYRTYHRQMQYLNLK